MEPLTLEELSNFSKGIILKGNPKMLITSLSTDTRTIKPFDFFIPLEGERFDGHDFIKSAFESGASGVLIAYNKLHKLSREIYKKYFENKSDSKAIVIVEDTRRALEEIAKNYRSRFAIPLIAVTGSNGKTTVKEMIAAILAQKFCVLKNPLSFNNLIGVPLTLLNLCKEHQLGVLEFGMNAPGEIKRLAEIASPKIGVILNVSYAHIEFFNSIEEIGLAKAELLEALPEDGIGIINLDDPIVSSLKHKCKTALYTFGIKTSTADFRAENINWFPHPQIGFQFQLVTPSGTKLIFLPGFEEHQIYNLLAAVACVYNFISDLDLIFSGITKFRTPSMRFEFINCGDCLIVNDAYNANPASTLAAIDSLFKIPSSGKKIAVLGDMLELGDYTYFAHAQIGKKLAQEKIDYLITVGELAQIIAKTAEESGLAKEKIKSVHSNHEAANLILSIKSPGDVILIKGSRKKKMEEIVNFIVKDCK